MKRLLQNVLRPVAALIIGLVALQPAVGGLFCGAPAAPCPLAITDSGPQCGAVSKADLDGSPHPVQLRGIARTMASTALPATRKILAPTASNAPSEVLPAPIVVSFVSAAAPARSKSPPIYIRNRVFRI